VESLQNLQKSPLHKDNYRRN